MRLLITGGAGFIGSNLATAAADAGHEVLVVDNLSLDGSAARLAELLARPRIGFQHCDIRSADDLERLPNGPFDRVFHFAASFANARSIDHPLVDLRTNAEGTLAVLGRAQRVGCGLFVYAGSSSSYGDAPVPFREDGPISPGTPYALTKLLGERYVAQSGLPHAILRLFNVYGPGDPPGPYRNAIPNMCQALDRPGGRVEVFGESATRDFTYVDDVVATCLAADRLEGRLVNVGTGVETSLLSLAAQLVALYPPRGTDDPTRDHERVAVCQSRAWDHVVRRLADNARLRAALPGACSTPLTIGLRRTATWLFEAGYVTQGPS